MASCYIRSIFFGFIWIIPFLVAGQECEPKKLLHSDFEVLENGDLMIVGDPGVSDLLMEADDQDKTLECHVFIFNEEGEKTFDERVSYSYPDEYYNFKDTAVRYGCREEETVQFEVYPRGDKGAFILGAFVGHQDLIHKIILDREHNPSEYEWFGGPSFPDIGWSEYKEMLERRWSEKYGEAYYRKEWTFDRTSGSCTAGPFSIERKARESELQYRENGKTHWTFSLNGYLDCDDPFATRKIIEYEDAYYISVIDDHSFTSCPSEGVDRVPILYKLSKEGELLWKIRYDTLFQDRTTTHSIVVDKEKGDKDFGRYDLRRVEVFRDSPLDSMVTYFHENGALHYKVRWKDGQRSENRIRYLSPKGDKNMEEIHREDGSVAVRRRFYPDGDIRSTSSFDKRGELQTKMIRAERGFEREFRVFENDTCVKRVLTDDKNESRVLVLEEKNGRSFYKPQKHELTLNLGNFQDPPQVLVHPDSSSDPIEAEYDKRRGLFVVSLAPPKILYKISIISDEMGPREVWNVPLTVDRSEFSKIRIKTFPKDWNSWFDGEQLRYYKPVDLRLGFLLRGREYEEQADSIAHSLRDLNLQRERSSFGSIASGHRRKRRKDEKEKGRIDSDIPAIIFKGEAKELIKAARRYENRSDVKLGWAIMCDGGNLWILRNKVRVKFEPTVSEKEARTILSREGFDGARIERTKIGSWKYDHGGKLRSETIPTFIATIELDWKQPEKWRAIAKRFNEEKAVMHVVQETSKYFDYSPWD